MSRAILFTVPFQALAMVLLASCAATPIVPVDSHPNAPQVFSIGDSSVITYKPDRDLYLTVTGSHLDESSSEINVSVSGECPGLPSEVTVVERKFSQFQIKFEKDYFNAVARPGCRATITVSITYRDPRRAQINAALHELQDSLDSDGHLRNDRRTSASKALETLDGAHVAGFRADVAINDQMEASDVRAAELAARQELADLGGKTPDQYTKTFRKTFELQSAATANAIEDLHRVSFNDIEAFPMSSEAVDDVFGSLVNENYYVVAIRVFNRSEADYVINTGLIGARGDVLVFAAADDRLPAFSVPIVVQPERMTFVYNFVEQRKSDKSREWIFRSLQFAGALATGIANAFSLGEDPIRGLGVFTGILIPEGEKLWPDHVPGHLRSIVTFGLPDVAKVPSGGSAGGVLFYAKTEIHSAIHSLDYYGRKGNELVQPEQFVAGLQLDGLDVRFERVANAADLKLLQDIADKRSREDAIATRDSFGSRLAKDVASFNDTKARITDSLSRATTLKVKIDKATESLRAASVDLSDPHLAAATAAAIAIVEASEGIKHSVDALSSEVATLDTTFTEVRGKIQGLMTDISITTDAKKRGDLSASMDQAFRELETDLGALQALLKKGNTNDLARPTLAEELTYVDSQWAAAQDAVRRAFNTIGDKDKKAKFPAEAKIWEP